MLPKFPAIVWALVIAGALGGALVGVAVLKGETTGSGIPGTINLFPGAVLLTGGGLTVGAPACDIPTFLNGKAIDGQCRVEATVTGSTQKIVGGKMARTATGPTSGGVAQWDLAIGVSAVEEVKKYTIKSGGTISELAGDVRFGWDNAREPLHIYDLKTGALTTNNFGYSGSCPNAGDRAILFHKEYVFLTGTFAAGACIRQQPVGSYGSVVDLDAGRAVIDIEVERVGAGSDKVRLNTDEGFSKPLPGGGKVEWLGGLTTLRPKPDVSSVESLWIESSPGWKMIDGRAYGQAKHDSAWGTFLGWGNDYSTVCAGSLGGFSCWTAIAGSTDTTSDAGAKAAAEKVRGVILGQFAPVNNIVTPAISAQSNLPSTVGEIASTSVLGDKANGKLEIITSRLLNFYRLNFELPMAWLGVAKESGKPEVTATSCDFRAGSIGAVAASVKNVGAGSGTFDVSVRCAGKVEQFGSASSVSVAPGQTGQVNIPVDATVETAAFSESCTVTATDRESFLTSSRPVTCTVAAAPKCPVDGATDTSQPGIVLICEGGDWKLLKSCPTGRPTLKAGGSPANPEDYLCPEQIIGQPAPGALVGTPAPFQPAGTTFTRPGPNLLLILAVVGILAAVGIGITWAVLRRRRNMGGGQMAVPRMR